MKSEETNNIKMRDYERFINAVLENPLLRSSEIVEEFITKEQNEFNILKLKYKNLKQVVETKNFVNLSGELDKKVDKASDKPCLALTVTSPIVFPPTSNSL